jgi:Uma2 family endonuclease
MATALKLGPADHGRALSFEEFIAADYQSGHRYELIRGRLAVSSFPEPPECYLENWLLDGLKAYALAHPAVINRVTNKARVCATEPGGSSYPQPDIAAYRNFPLQRWFELRWEEVSPVLVVEVLDPDNPKKDTERNVEVYLAIPSIKEYWLLDTRPGFRRPTLRVHRRHGKRWRILDVPFGATYTTRLLPGFELIVDPTR